MNSTFETLIASSRRDPQRNRLTFLHEDGGVEALCGRDLIDRTEALAAGLQSISKPGDRILLAYPAGPEFIVGFLACQRASLIPVPVSYPKPRRPISRYRRIATDSQAALALTNQAMLEVIDPRTLEGVAWYSEQSWSADPETLQPALPPGSGDQTVFLQYTSGSTSDPKGVMVTHNNLMANLQAIREGFQIDLLDAEHRVVCGWLPAYHDMGLVGLILAALYHDGHAVMMSPSSFVQRPSRWLRAISDYRAAVTVAPCFGYDWAAEKIQDADLEGVDLSCLNLAACGAEPIFDPVLRRFSKRFEPLGFHHQAFYPCYGLAESTLMVTGTDRGGRDATVDGVEHLPGPVTQVISRQGLRESRAIEPASPSDEQLVISSGLMAKDTLVVIADPNTAEPLPENAVGEIRVHSPSVAAGYWNHHELTEEVFHTRLSGDKRRFLRTGDLGFLREGQLYVTGRLKDTIIIAGQNHYPQDIERSVTVSHPKLQGFAGAAFAVNGEQGERLVMVHEIARGATADDHQEIIRAIRMAIARSHELAVDEVVLIRPAALPRTSSGKVQRNLCRTLFLEGSLKTFAHWQHAGTYDASIFPDLSEIEDERHARGLVERRIEDALLEWLQRYTNIAPEALQAGQTFAELGVDSLMAVELSQQIEAWLGLRLSPVAAYSYPTTTELAQHLTTLILGPEEASFEQPADQQLDDLVQSIDALDEAEVEALLRQSSE